MAPESQADSLLVDRLLAVVAAVLEDGPQSRADAWCLVSLLPASQLRRAVRLLAEEVALRTVAPAEDRAVALGRLRAWLLAEAVARD